VAPRAKSATTANARRATAPAAKRAFRVVRANHAARRTDAARGATAPAGTVSSVPKRSANARAFATPIRAPMGAATPPTSANPALRTPRAAGSVAHARRVPQVDRNAFRYRRLRSRPIFLPRHRKVANARCAIRRRVLTDAARPTVIASPRSKTARAGTPAQRASIAPFKEASATMAAARNAFPIARERRAELPTAAAPSAPAPVRRGRSVS